MRSIARSIERLAAEVEAHPWKRIIMLSYQLNDAALITTAVTLETPGPEEIERMIEDQQR